MYDKNNVFAKILRGEIPCNKIAENQYAIAFPDISPKAPVHILVIPRGEYINLLEFQQSATKQESDGFWALVKQVVDDFGLSDNSYRLVANTGAPMQEVPHLHIHIMADKPSKQGQCSDWCKY